MNTITPNSLSDSWLETLAKWLRGKTMNDWLKIGLGAAGAVIVAWTMIQQHEYRLGQVEHALDTHLDQHERQYREISQTLHDIDITLARMHAGDKPAAAYTFGNGHAIGPAQSRQTVSADDNP